MSTREPLFSVIVPAFDAEATIASALTSALGQTLKDLELIVVNDGSTDGTAAIVENVPDPRVRLLSQSNRGLPAARNAGIAVPRGKYIAFLDSDDLWLPRPSRHRFSRTLHLMGRLLKRWESRNSRGTGRRRDGDVRGPVPRHG